MSLFTKFHGITLAGGTAKIENLVVESLAADPALVVAGRMWYNSTDKKVRMSRIDGLGALEMMTLGGSEDIALAIQNDKDLLASVLLGEGTALVGFVGETGANGELVVPAGTVENTLKQIIGAVDADMKAFNDYVASNDQALVDMTTAYELADTTLQENIDATNTDLSTNYLSKTSTDIQNVAAEVHFAQDVVISGQVKFDGDLTEIQKEVVKLSDNIITLNAGATGAPSENAGLEVDRGDEGILPYLIWDEASDSVKIAQWDATLNDGAGGFVNRNISTEEDLALVNATLDARIDELENNVGGATGDLATLTTDAKTDLVAAVNEVDAHADAAQAELDATQTGAGLAANGAYVPQTTSNYINSATSLDGADILLDAQAKVNADAIAAETVRATDAEGINAQAISDEETSRINADNTLSGKIDDVESGAGLSIDGAYVPQTTSNYIDAATSLNSADILLDNALKIESDARVAADTALDLRVDDLENSVGGDTGDLTTLTTDAKTDLVSAINEVDANADAAQVSANDAQAELDVTQTTIGASIAADGTYVKDDSLATPVTNYLQDNASITEDIRDLDTQVKVNENSIANLTSSNDAKIDKIEASVGLAENGDYVVESGANYIAGATTEHGATNALDGALKTQADKQASDLANTNNAISDAATNVETNYLSKTSVSNQSVASAEVEFQTIRINGDIIQSGETITTVGETVTFEDNIIELNSNILATDEPIENAGLSVNRGTGGKQNIVIWDELNDKLIALRDVNGSTEAEQMDNVAFETDLNAVETALDSRIDELENNVGGATGDLATLTTDAKTDLVAAVNEVDAHADAAQAELDATQTGAGLAADGAYSANVGANYIAAATSLNDADSKLDAQSKLNADAIVTEAGARSDADTLIQTELDATQTGAGLAADGTYTVNGSTNFISGVTTITGATEALDNEVKRYEDAVASQVVGEGSANVGYGGKVGANGNFSLPAGSVEASLDAVTVQLDGATGATETLRNNLNGNFFTFLSAAATTHTITHNLNCDFVDYTYWVKEDTTWQNSIIGVTEIDANTIEFNLSEAKEIKGTVEAIRTV